MGEVLEKLGGENAPAEEQKNKTLAEVLAEPLTEDEAKKMLADSAVQLAQMRALRIQKSAEISQIDYQIAAAEFDQAVIYRRVLNAAPESK